MTNAKVTQMIANNSAFKYQQITHYELLKNSHVSLKGNNNNKQNNNVEVPH